MTYAAQDRKARHADSIGSSPRDGARARRTRLPPPAPARYGRCWTVSRSRSGAPVSLMERGNPARSCEISDRHRRCLRRECARRYRSCSVPAARRLSAAEFLARPPPLGRRAIRMSASCRGAARCGADGGAGRRRRAACRRVRPRGRRRSGRRRARALIDLTHGTLRRYGRVQAIVRRAVDGAAMADSLVEALLWCSLYALDSGRYAEYTVVDQAVRACGMLERWNAKGYVNALLRGFLRERGSLEARIQADLKRATSIRAGGSKSCAHAYPGEARCSARGGQFASADVPARQPAACAALRQYQEQLARRRHWHAARWATKRCLLERPVPVERLPGFARARSRCRTPARNARRTASICADGQRVLDACAAPGGKSGHILERAQVALTALDVDAARCARASSATSSAWGLSRASCVPTARGPRTWWDGEPFDRILADVPCSASGIARRHPDIKWLRRADDVGGVRRAPGHDSRRAVAGARRRMVNCCMPPARCFRRRTTR